MVETKIEIVLGSNFYVCRGYREKFGRNQKYQKNLRLDKAL